MSSVSFFARIQAIIFYSGGTRQSLRKALKILITKGPFSLIYSIKAINNLIFEENNACMPSNQSNDKASIEKNCDRLKENYQQWINQYDTLTTLARRVYEARIISFANPPLISVLMPTYNTPVKFLEEAIKSVQNQIYPYWELCIADDFSSKQEVREVIQKFADKDERIKFIFRQSNGHISQATNSALEISNGNWVALMDHDDLLPENALYWVAESIIANPKLALIYSDEDKIDEFNVRSEPYFKPDFNYELLLAQNMISHLGVYKADLIKLLGGFRLGFEGAQDYDIALRVIEKIDSSQIKHIPRVLYHWRAITGSTAYENSEKDYAALSGRKAVEDHLIRVSKPAKVVPAPRIPFMNRVIFDRSIIQPMLSILIPTRDRIELLANCIDSILNNSTYKNFEIIVIDNGSVEEASIKYFESVSNDRIRIIRDVREFNFSALNNLAVKYSRGDYLCLLNNDIEILTADWMEEMLSFASQDGVGCVGAKLLYPDGRVQHGGVICGIGGVAGHSHKYLNSDDLGYFGRMYLHHCVSAVTGACLMVKKSIYDKLGGLDEGLAVAFNDIDFCLRVRAAGYRNVWTPYAEFLHYESVSRGYEDTQEKIIRFGNETTLMKERWLGKLYNDPMYNPNLTSVAEDFSLAFPSRVSQFN